MARHQRGLSLIGRIAALMLIVTVVAAACDNGSGQNGSGENGSGDAAATLDEALADHVAGRIDEARQGYLDVLDLEPDDSFALYNLGLIAQNESDLTTAQDFYRRSLAVDPDFEAAVFNLAIVEAQLDNPDEAIDLYQQIIEINPENAGAHLNLGFLYLELGKEKKGNNELQRAIKLDPSLSDRIVSPKGAASEEPSSEPSE